jgi:hypothetical protein
LNERAENRGQHENAEYDVLQALQGTVRLKKGEADETTLHQCYTKED